MVAKPRSAYRMVRAEARVQWPAIRAQRQLRWLASRPGRLVLGPWLSEVGFEVLYWIPMLRWAASHVKDWDPDRVIAVTRGGAGTWYAGLANQSFDVFERMTPEDLRAHHEAKYAASRSQKQMAVEPIDREILADMEAALGGERYTLLHPSLMYNLFRAFWSRRRPITFVQHRTHFDPLPMPEVDAETAAAIDALPAPYVAVKAYFSSCFPDTPENREWLTATLRDLSRTHHVVLLDTPFVVDDHRDYALGDEPRVVSVAHLMRPETNLAVQSRVVAGADALLTTYGGFSYLGPFLGVPTFSFHSDENFNQTHLDVMARADKHLRVVGGSGQFVSFSVAQAEILGRLAGRIPERAER